MTTEEGDVLECLAYHSALVLVQAGDSAITAQDRARMQSSAGLLRSIQSFRPAPPLSPAEFYASRAWRELRYQALARWGAVCQACGVTRRAGVRIHVDHIKPRSIYPELALQLDNLQVLCEDCNLGKSNRDETDWRA